MKRGQIFGWASIGVALAAACGGVNGSGDDGGLDGSGSSSGSSFSSGGTASSSGPFGSGGTAGSSGTASSSGAASSGGRTASSSGTGSSGAASSSGGRRDAGGSSSGLLVRTNRCPICPGSQVCCLAGMGGSLQGTCAATAASCPSGAASIPCMGGGDCNGGQVCCITIASSSGPSSTSCQASCPSGSPPSCGGRPSDNGDCPGGPNGWTCQPVAGTPTGVLGQCIPAEGGAPPGDGGDATAGDSGAIGDGATPPQDAAGDGG